MSKSTLTVLLAILLAACSKRSIEPAPAAEPLVTPVPNSVTPSASASPTAKPVDNPYGFDVLAAIDRGREILEKGEPAGYRMCQAQRTVWSGKGKKRTKRVIKFERMCDVSTKLAVRQIKDDRIQIITVRADGTSTPSGYRVTYIPSRSVNTEFDVTHPPGHLVLAIRRAIPIRDKGPTEVVYTPYSSELNIPLVRKAGEKYLWEKAIGGMNRLSDAHWPLPYLSRYPEIRTWLTEMAYILAVNEHVDPDRFLSGIPAEQLLNQVMVTIGVNRPLAYRYAVSPVGARGLFQFMPDTYAGLVRNNMGAGLIPEFVSGTDDHVNAATASILLFDDILKAFTQAERDDLADDRDEFERVLAASYNYGPGRVRRKKLIHEDWVSELPEETRTYVDKFEAFKSLLFPTPKAPITNL